jgi:uncharacterized protein
MQARQQVKFRSRSYWPDESLNFDRLRATQWEPVAFQDFQLKITSRCNLSCDYCYMYKHADQSWKTQPVFMSESVVRQSTIRIREHIEAYDVKQAIIILHGGEPLLCGEARLRSITRIIREVLAGLNFIIALQTNGTLLDESMALLCADLEIGVGISFDGEREANDRHRLDRRGDSSYDATMRAIEVMQRPAFSPWFGGVLCVIDLANDPIELYEYFVKLGVPGVDFLPPDGNWSQPPPRKSGDPSDTATPYADWLIPIFDRWFHAPEQELAIRFFSNILRSLVGGYSATGDIGLAPVRIAAIGTNGNYEHEDIFRTTFDGAIVTKMNVFDHAIDALLETPQVMARQIGADALCSTCLRCDVASVCGGGTFVHRYREDVGFRNPSVYCGDLYRLISHIQPALFAELEKRGFLDAEQLSKIHEFL